MKQMFFLHGLPRAGNTLLSSILNQNPNIALTANSVCPEMLGMLNLVKGSGEFVNFPDHNSFDNVTKSLFKNYYKDWTQDYIIDRAPWGYPVNLKNLREIEDNIKIIVLVRDMEEVLASFIKFTNKQPNSRFNNIAYSIEHKCNILLNPNTFNLHKMWEGIKNLWDNESKETYHLIDYHTLCNTPQETIEGIYNFLDIPLWEHRFTNLEQFKVNDMKYDDTRNDFGEGLHTIDTQKIYTHNHNENILPPHIIDRCKNLNFWKNNN